MDALDQSINQFQEYENICITLNFLDHELQLFGYFLHKEDDGLFIELTVAKEPFKIPFSQIKSIEKIDLNPKLYSTDGVLTLKIKNSKIRYDQPSKKAAIINSNDWLVIDEIITNYKTILASDRLTSICNLNLYDLCIDYYRTVNEQEHQEQKINSSHHKQQHKQAPHSQGEYTIDETLEHKISFKINDLQIKNAVIKGCKAFCSIINNQLIYTSYVQNLQISGASNSKNNTSQNNNKIDPQEETKLYNNTVENLLVLNNEISNIFIRHFHLFFDRIDQNFQYLRENIELIQYFLFIFNKQKALINDKLLQDSKITKQLFLTRRQLKEIQVGTTIQSIHICFLVLVYFSYREELEIIERRKNYGRFAIQSVLDILKRHYSVFLQNLKKLNTELTNNHFDEELLNQISIPTYNIDEAKSDNFLISYFLAITESQAYDFEIHIPNPELKEKFFEYLKSHVTLTKSFSFNEYFKDTLHIFNKWYTELKRNLLEINRKINFYNLDNVYLLTNRMLESINSNTATLFMDDSAKHDLRVFLEDLALISSKKATLDELNKMLSRPDSDYNQFIKPSEHDPITHLIYYALQEVNEIIHSEQFLEIVFRRFEPKFKIECNQKYINFNQTTQEYYIPLKIIVSKQDLEIQSITIKHAQHSQSLDHRIKLLRDKVNYEIIKINKQKLNLENTTFDLELCFEYTFIKSFDLRSKKFIYEHQNFSQIIHCSYKEKETPNTTPNNNLTFTPLINKFAYFSNGSVVTDQEMFIGRTDLISQMSSKIRDRQGNKLSNNYFIIYGQTRTGKSTLLYHLKEKLKQDQNNIIIDLGDIGTSSDLRSGYFFLFIQKLIEQIEDEQEDLYDKLLELDYDLDLELNKVISEFKQSADLYFHKLIGKFCSILNKYFKHKKIIVLMDEFTYIYERINNNELNPHFIREWKGITSQYDICSIVIGQDHTPKLLSDHRFSNLFNDFNTIELSYLDAPSAKELITKPLMINQKNDAKPLLTTDAIDLLIEYTAGNPYLLMNLCSKLVDYININELTTVNNAYIYDFFKITIENLEEKIFEPLYCDKITLDSQEQIQLNKAILKKIALATRDQPWIDISSINFTDNELNKLNDLVNRHVINKKDDLINIRIKLYAEWIRRLN